MSLSAAADEDESRLLDASSSTPSRDDVRVKDGFCQVGSRLPNAESATPAPPSPRDRWTGGNPAHAPGTGPPYPTTAADGAPA
ncbi:hypothetical protein [Streptomyces sp. NPDC017940]|uniref:hypothetical protein n=1 Tax=Streptomyces sp. NPDC017940 TaxID=3365017 RepID=UPI003795C13C